MRFSILRGALALLVSATAAACDYSSAYSPTAPHDVPPPQVAAFPTGLWTVSGALSEISRLDDAQLLTSGLKTPATRLFAPTVALTDLNSIAFDSAGTMWVGSRDSSSLVGFTNGNDAGTSAPSIIIRSKSRSIAEPSAMAFDADRALWVANAEGTIVRFDRTQLMASGSPVPAVTITGVAHPTGLAFDVTGALWVTDAADNTVSKFTRAQLLSSGNKAAAVVLTASGFSLVNPTGIAFDSFNNMWITNTGAQSVVAFRPPQRDATGSPVPFLTLAPGLLPLESPTGIAFDQTGNLWVMGISGLLSKFTALEIAASGPAEPSLQMRMDNHMLLWNIAFWPKPSGFPLN